MAARADILEKVKKSRQEAERRIQESNKKDEQARQASQREYQQNTSSETKQAASYMKQYSTPERAGNTVSDYAQKRKQLTSWYKGDKPTEIETLAKIVKETERDRAFGEKLYGYYEQAKQEGEWAETYDKATSRYAAALGLPEGTAINDEFFEQMKPYFAAGVTTDAGNLSTAKKNGADALFAANLAGLYDDYQKTKTLKAESDNMFKEIQYWVAQGLTDDEIRKKVDIEANGAYGNLRKAKAKTATGEYEPTTEAIPALTSYGVDGMIWAARNPGKSTGDYKLDAVQGAMGRGVQHTSTPEEIARRTPGSDTYSPYANGTTMDKEAIMFGVGKEFSADWLDKNRAAVLARNDEKEIAAFNRVYDAEMFTREAESEYKGLMDQVETTLKNNPDLDADTLIGMIFGSEDAPNYKALAKLDQSFKDLDTVSMTRGIDYDRKSLEKMIRDTAASAQLRAQATTDSAAMETVVGEEKKAAAGANGGKLLTPGVVDESVPDSVTRSVAYDGANDDNFIANGVAWLKGQMAKLEKNRLDRKQKKETEKQQKLEEEQKQKEAEDKLKLEESEKILSEPDTSSAKPEPVAVVANAGASDIAPKMTAEEFAAAQEQVYALEAEGRYDEAAKAQFPLIVAAVTNSDDEYVKELVTSVGSQETALHLVQLVLQGDMLDNVDDLDVFSSVTDYEYYICKVLDIDTASADAISQAMSFVTGALDYASGGAYTDTKDNEGVGVLRTVQSAAKQGLAKANDALWAEITGAAITGYGYAAKGTSWLIDNTLGKLFGFKSQSWADQTIEAGQKLSAKYDKISEREDAFMRQNATPLEYYSAAGGGEAIKMGIQSATGSAVAGAVAPSVSQVMTTKDGLKTLTTAMDIAKIEGLTTHLAAATPFIAESTAKEFNATYAETGNPVTALLAGTVSGFATTALMNMDAIKNIERMGKYVPEVTDALRAMPGTGMLASGKRYGKAGMMYIGNMFKTAANEMIQEPTENILTTWVTDTLKGKGFFTDRDWEAYSKELAQDTLYAAIGAFGNTIASMPSWSRSAVYANQTMGKTGLTAQEVVGQVNAFIEDMNDPQVVAQLEANLNETAVEVRTGELVREGALPEVDTSAVTAAEKGVKDAEDALVDAEIALTQATAESDAALAAFQQGPSDKNTARLSAALKQEDKAKQDQQKASAGLQQAQTALGEAQGAVQAQSNAAMETVREQAKAEVEQAGNAVAESRKAETVADTVETNAPATQSVYTPESETNAPDVNMNEQDAERAQPITADQVIEAVDDIIAEEVSRYKAELDKGNEEFREKYVAKQEELKKRNKYRGQIRKGMEELVQMLRNPTGKKHVIAGLDTLVSDFVQAVDLGSRGKKVLDLNEKINKLAAAFAENNANPDSDILIDPEIVENMNILAEEAKGLGSFGKLSTEQMRDLRDMVRSVKHAVKTADTMFTSRRKARISDVATRSIQQISQKADYKKGKGLVTKMRDLMNVGMLDSFHFFDSLGSASKEVFNGLREGLDRKTTNIQTAIEFAKSLVKDADRSMFMGDKTPKTTFTVSSGANIELTKPQVMELYCLSKREAAQRHLLQGGIRTDDNAVGVALTKEDIDAIVSTLSNAEIAIADGLQNFMSTVCADWANETSMTMSGYRKFREKSYYPMKVDSNTTKTSQDTSAQSGDIYAILNKGFTKDLRRGAANKLMLGNIFETFSSYVDDVTTYAAYAAPVYDLIRWFNYKSSDGANLKTTLEQKIGNVGKSFVTTLIKDLNGSTGRSYSPGIAEELTRRGKSASIGWNIRVAIQQPTAIVRAAMVLDPKYIAKGASATPSAIKEAISLAQQYCPIAAWKSMGFYETDIGDSLTDMMFPANKSLKEKANDAGMWLPGKMDEITFGALWRACEAETGANDPSLNGKALYEATGKRLAEVIDYTQVVDTPLHRTQLMRSKNFGVQTATAFLSEPAKTYNMLHGAIANAKANPNNASAKAQVGRALAVYTAGQIATALAQSLWDGVRDDDDDEYLERVGHALLGDYEKAETVGDYAKAFFQSNLGSAINPLDDFPYVKDVVSMMQGYDPTRIGLQAVTKFIKVANQIPKAIKGESEWNAYQWVKSIASAYSYAFGVGAENAIRDCVSIYNTIAGAFGADKITARTQEPTLGEQAEHIYDAIVAGDVSEFDKWVGKAKGGEKPKNDNDIDLKVAEILAKEDDRIAVIGDLKNKGNATEVERQIVSVVATLTAGGVIDEKRAKEIVDKAVKSYEPKQETVFDPDKQLNAKLYSAQNAADALFAMAGENPDGLTPEDIQLMLSEIASDSTAKNPNKTTIANVKSAVKEKYIELYRENPNSELLADLWPILYQELAVDWSTIQSWQEIADED